MFSGGSSTESGGTLWFRGIPTPPLLCVEAVWADEGFDDHTNLGHDDRRIKCFARLSDV